MSWRKLRLSEKTLAVNTKREREREKIGFLKKFTILLPNNVSNGVLLGRTSTDTGRRNSRRRESKKRMINKRKKERDRERKREKKEKKNKILLS